MESRTYISLKRDVGSIFVVQWIAQLEDGKVKAINEVWSPHKPCSKDESELLNDYAVNGRVFGVDIDFCRHQPINNIAFASLVRH